MTSQKTAVQPGLPKETQSLCPECNTILKATIYEKNGKVLMKKTCKQHGTFEDTYWSDVTMYLKAENWAHDGKGVSNPQIPHAQVCPQECGLCDLHLSHTSLALIDLTNRCNLQCPICFANANAAGYVFEPSYDQIVKMMEMLRAEQPVPCKALQFAGGEPTIYPQFFEVIAKAKELGFAQIQVATNGLKMADLAFCQKMKDAGMNTIYLQFDGLTEQNYIQTRGRKLLDAKLKVIENCRKVKPKPLSTVLVPTVVKTINDDQVGEIVKFAIKNSDVVRGVNFQPVSFTGRIDNKQLEQQRYTIPDLISDLEKQTDFLQKDDFYPVPVVTPISDLISVLSGREEITFTAHPHCGYATFVFIHDGKVTPIPRFVNIEGLFHRMEELTVKVKKYKLLIKLFKSVQKKTDLGKLFDKYFGEFIDKNKMPEGIDIVDILSTVAMEKDKKSVGEFAWKTMLIGAMHFQDSYNYDIERVKRCVVHYATPDMRIIPFCAYNGGPTYRTEVEKKFSTPLSEWKKREKQ
jgi:hypothetical protein